MPDTSPLLDFLGLKHVTSAVERAFTNLLNAIQKGIGNTLEPAVNNLKSKSEQKSLVRAIETSAQEQQKLIKSVSDQLNFIKESALTQVDSEILKRTLLNLTERQLERQFNKEKIALMSIEDFKFLSELKEPQHSTINNDWLSLFWKTVEDISAEDIQSIFSRILADEAIKPGSYKPRTLHILSIMNSEDAKSFELVCRYSIRTQNDVFVIDPEEFDDFDIELPTNQTLYNLEGLGLITTSHLSYFENADNGGKVELGDKEFTFQIVDQKEFDANHERTFMGYPFTHSGRELRNLIKRSPATEFTKVFETYIVESIGCSVTPLS